MACRQRALLSLRLNVAQFLAGEVGKFLGVTKSCGWFLRFSIFDMPPPRDGGPRKESGGSPRRTGVR
jgi:hypothetical protein